MSLRLFIALLFGAAVTGALRGEDSSDEFLRAPISSYYGAAPRDGLAEPAVTVDGTALSFGDPDILIARETDGAKFTSAMWKDAHGQPVHQRDVFARSGYIVIVDYILVKGRWKVARQIIFAEEKVEAIGNGAEAVLATGKTVRVQALDSGAAVTATAGIVQFSSEIDAPVPLAEVVIAESGGAAPKVEYIKPANPMIVKCKITLPDGTIDEVALAWERRPLHLEGREFKGWAVCLRQSSAGSSAIEIN